MPFVYSVLKSLVVASMCLLAAVAAAAPVAVVVNGSLGPTTVHLINVVSGAPIGDPIRLASPSAGVLVSPDGARAYILTAHRDIYFGPGELHVLDIGRRTFVRTLPLMDGAASFVMSPNGRTIYIVHPNFNTLSTVDTQTLTVSSRAIRNPLGVAVDPAGESVYVINAPTELSVLRAADLALVSQTAMPGRPGNLAVTPDSRHLVVVDREDGVNSGSVYLYSLESGSVVRRVAIGPRDHYVVLDGGGTTAYISGNGIDVKAVDFRAANPLRRIAAGGGGLSLTASGEELWVMNPAAGNVAVVETAGFTVARTVSGLDRPSSFGTFIATPLAPGAVRVVEFYYRALDHYFMTVDPGEIAALDSGTTSGWSRTGLFFDASASGPPARPVCRFYGLPSAGLDSHFYSADAIECEEVERKFGGAWKKETDSAFAIEVPARSTGDCAVGTLPVWRFWNGRADSNHRYTANASVRQPMLDAGYVAEGYGPSGRVMCARAF